MYTNKLGELEERAKSTTSKIPVNVFYKINKAVEDREHKVEITMPKGISSATTMEMLKECLTLNDSIRLAGSRRTNPKTPSIPHERIRFNREKVYVVGRGLIRRFNEFFHTYGQY